MKATSNAGALFSSMLGTADADAINAELAKKDSKLEKQYNERWLLFEACRDGGCPHFIDKPKNRWTYCRCNKQPPRRGFDITKCPDNPNYKPSTDCALPQSTEEGRRAATSAREARDDKCIS